MKRRKKIAGKMTDHRCKDRNMSVRCALPVGHTGNHCAPRDSQGLNTPAPPQGGV